METQPPADGSSPASGSGPASGSDGDAPADGSAFPAARTAEELREFVLGVCDNKIFTDRHCRSPEDVQSVFMILALGCLEGRSEDEVSNIGCVWEWVDQASPRTMNGYPMFVSVRFLNLADTERASAAIITEMARRKEITV